MKTKQIIQEYFNCKNRVVALSEELKFLEKTPEFVKVTKYGEELSKRYLGIEDVHIRILDKRRELELQIAIDKGFIARVDYTLAALKRDLGKSEYEIFELRYFKKRTLEFLSIKYGYAHPSSIHRKLKKQEQLFEEMINISEMTSFISNH